MLGHCIQRSNIIRHNFLHANSKGFSSILGTYESGIASYKHMYFNATQNTLKIWVLIVLGIIAMYECIKLLVFLIIQNKVRYSMVVLFGLSIFSHYYGWWAYINYYNDEYYSQWNHQLFFSVSVYGLPLGESVATCRQKINL